MKQKDKVLSVLDNAVTLTALPDKLTADHSSPLHLQWCLQRRGLALDMCRVLSWHTREKWLAFLLQALTREVPQGPVSINQLLRADSEMFLLISKQVTSLKPDSAGVMQVDQAMLQLKTDPRVTMHLLPLPKSAAPASAPAEDDKPPAPHHQQRTRTRTPAKKKGLLAAVKTENLPAELKSAKFLTYHDNRRLCWSHSCEGCKLEATGQPPACRKGVHACAYCRKPGHGARSCWNNPPSPSFKCKASGAAQE